MNNILTIKDQMIKIEEMINLLEHRLGVKFNNRHDLDRNSDSQIVQRIAILETSWDLLADKMANS